MWTIPPIIGQKVTLNPGHERYSDYNIRQAKGSDGVIIEVYSSFDWVTIPQSTRDNITIRVRWQNGHTNSYKLSHLLPLSGSFYKLKRYSFKNEGILFSILEESDNEKAERYIIDEGFKFEISMFDKDKRIEILKKHMKVYDDVIGTIRESDEVLNRINESYAGIAEELAHTERAEAVDWLEEATKRYPKSVMKEQPTFPFEVRDIDEALSTGVTYRPINELFRMQNEGEALTQEEYDRLQSFLEIRNQLR